MQKVYLVKSDGASEAMKPIRAASEAKDLQNLLARNFDLLPGDQIDPDDSCRWMLIKQEMPVPIPGTGNDCSLDFLFVDQHATPTLVECKLFKNPQSRRDVVGQLIEYAANARHYWTVEQLLGHVDATAKKAGLTIDDAFGELRSDFDSPDELIGEAMRRLSNGDMRLIFFLEEAPAELKRSVEFMNEQMGSVEVLLVEARQFEAANGPKVIAPVLFGFTERIREIKRARQSGNDRGPVAVDWVSFEANARSKDLDDKTIEAIRQVYDVCKELQADIAWGRGTATGSFSPKWPSIHPTIAPFSVFANGRLELHFSFTSPENAVAFRTAMVERLVQGGFQLPNGWENQWPTLRPSDWLPKLEVLLKALQNSVGANLSQAAAA